MLPKTSLISGCDNAKSPFADTVARIVNSPRVAVLILTTMVARPAHRRPRLERLRDRPSAAPARSTLRPPMPLVRSAKSDCEGRRRSNAYGRRPSYSAFVRHGHAAPARRRRLSPNLSYQYRRRYARGTSAVDTGRMKRGKTTRLKALEPPQRPFPTVRCLSLSSAGTRDASQVGYRTSPCVAQIEPRPVMLQRSIMSDDKSL